MFLDLFGIKLTLKIVSGKLCEKNVGCLPGLLSTYRKREREKESTCVCVKESDKKRKRERERERG